MSERFPLSPATTEESRGVSPESLRDLGYELPYDYSGDEEDSRRLEFIREHLSTVVPQSELGTNRYWPDASTRETGRLAIQGPVHETLEGIDPKNPSVIKRAAEIARKSKS